MDLLLIFGGASTEHEISCVSASNVFKYIDKDKYNVHLMYITREGVWKYIKNATYSQIENGNLDGVQAVLSPDTSHSGIILLDTYEILKIDCIFPVLHGKNGEDGVMQGLFELARIPYVGCNVSASANSMDKSLTKTIINEIKVQQCSYELIIKHSYDENVSICEKYKNILFPSFVKPCSSGSSVGVSRVCNEEELKNAVEIAFKFDDKVLVEQEIIGREIEVAVLGNENPISSVAGEIASGSEFYSYDAKYKDNSSQLFIPARISEKCMNDIRENALKVYKALGCSGLSRVDFFVTEDEQLIFNEINTLPGFTNISMYPKLFEYSSIKYTDLIDKIIEFAMLRGDKIGQ